LRTRVAAKVSSSRNASGGFLMRFNQSLVIQRDRQHRNRFGAEQVKS
jgi:hypothetical protein